jgi:hypothetical protein
VPRARTYVSCTDATTAPARPYSYSPARVDRLCRIRWQVHRRITLLGIIALFPLLSSAELARSEGLWSCRKRLSRSSADLYDFQVSSWHCGWGCSILTRAARGAQIAARDRDIHHLCPIVGPLAVRLSALGKVAALLMSGIQASILS